MKKNKSYPRGYKHLLRNFEALIRNLCLKHSILDFKTENILTMWTKWTCLCECQWCNIIQPKLSNKWQRTVLNFQSHDKLAFHSNNRFPSKGFPFEFSSLVCKCKSNHSFFAKLKQKILSFFDFKENQSSKDLTDRQTIVSDIGEKNIGQIWQSEQALAIFVAAPDMLPLMPSANQKRLISLEQVIILIHWWW